MMAYGVGVVSRTVARRYKVASGDSQFLSQHPTPESLVVQASCSAQSAPGSFPATPSDRESKRMEQAAKKGFSSCSMAFKSVNATCVLGRYVHALMDTARAVVPRLPPDVQEQFDELLLDIQVAGKQIIQLGFDTADSAASAMATSVVTRRHV
ncbi:hypothetical protein NDU88_004850 [Pleurodeles waltl]|uniref:Uncharacterized protein n=1 Tax=Pleurodeles waltl TaxID=8319 RepID=A0AAV7PDR9_PLEWA|nr:hypothetical protein NDU88_004850 [Pleurodeles waltl]